MRNELIEVEGSAKNVVWAVYLDDEFLKAFENLEDAKHYVEDASEITFNSQKFHVYKSTLVK